MFGRGVARNLNLPISQSMSASQSRSSSRTPYATTASPTATSKSTTRRVHSPSGSSSPSPAPLSRQLSARASVKGPRSSARALQPSEQISPKSSLDHESTQDVLNEIPNALLNEVVAGSSEIPGNRAFEPAKNRGRVKNY